MPFPLPGPSAATHNRGNNENRLAATIGAGRAVEGRMSEKIYDVSAEWTERAFVNDAKYREMYARSVNDPNGFWAEQGKRVEWIKPFTKVEHASFEPGNISI